MLTEIWITFLTCSLMCGLIAFFVHVRFIHQFDNFVNRMTEVSMMFLWMGCVMSVIDWIKA